jgi:hypothetical protein
MWQLFRHLPRDLRWEVLSEFVGSHAVRKGKLIKKMVFGARHQMVQNIHRIHVCYIGVYNEDFNAKTFVTMRDGSQLMFCEHPYGETGYTFRRRIVRECSWMPKCYGQQYTPMNDSVVLPQFEKHAYPSYPFTNKKKAVRYPVQKPLSLRLPSEEEEDDVTQPKSPDGPPPPRSPDGPPPPRSPDGPPPPRSPDGPPPPR